MAEERSTLGLVQKHCITEGKKSVIVFYGFPVQVFPTLPDKRLDHH